MNWLKGLGSSVWIAVLAFLAAMAGASALRHKNAKEKWQEKSVAIEEGNVIKGVKSAEAASTQAKLHEAKAKEVKKKAQARQKQIKDSPIPIEIVLKNWQ